MKRSRSKDYKLLLLLIIVIFALVNLFLSSSEIKAEPIMSSDNFEITWPNINTGSGGTTSPNFNMGITTGQNAPGLYSSTGYKIRSGFQYIHSIIPFSFQLSAISLNFGSLALETLANEQGLTLTVNSGSAGGYQVKVQENDPLKSTTGTTIPDTTCDVADTCTHTDAGVWTETSTYGFGYTISGDDIPSEFSGGKFKNFPDAPGEDPVKIMGLTPATGHAAGIGKTAAMTARINISTIQAAGVYRNILTFFAIPTY